MAYLLEAIVGPEGKPPIAIQDCDPNLHTDGSTEYLRPQSSQTRKLVLGYILYIFYKNKLNENNQP